MDQRELTVIVLRKITDCPDGKVCPAVIALSTKPRHRVVVGKVSGTPAVVDIPDELIPEATALPIATDRQGYKMMAGQPVLDQQEIAALAEHIGPGEAAVLVPLDQLPEALHDVA